MNFNIDKLNNYITEKMDEFCVPSISIAVVYGEEVVYNKCFGYKDLEKQLPPDENTVYAIASLSKAMTAACAGILVDEGKLSWDEPVITYLPEFRMYDEFATKSVTLRDMLSHNTGLPRHDMSWYGDGSLSTKDIVERIAYLKPNKSPRSLYEYNNFMFAAAGYVIERVSGQSWGDFIKERIFMPLGMDQSTTVIEGLSGASNKALPYKGGTVFTEGKSVPEAVLKDYLNFDGMAACGTVNSTIKDMAKWASMNLMKGEYKGKRVISEKNLNEIHTPHTVKRGDELIPEIPVLCYGLGWNTRVYRGRFNLAHAGGIDGFSTHLSLLPNENIGIVILTNRSGTAAHFAVANTIKDHILGLPEKDWMGYLKGTEDKGIAEIMKDNEAIIAARGNNKNAPHSKKLEEYVGVYENKGYGKAGISLVNDKLLLSYNGFDKELTHNNYDTFDFDLSDDYIENRVIARFVLDKKGNVSEFHVDFEKAMKGELIQFNKL
ncbi:MAG: serine hydrolase [Defluviitaleaceae bacterium]|nr:serine hydrolase [Defluviitaleaceae bacterium]